MRVFRSNRLRRGFTLIEIMVVVLVIAILMGVTFRLVGTSSNAAARADTIAKMERLHSALGAFYAEYGYYPPSAYWDLGLGEAVYCYMPVTYIMPVPSSIEGQAGEFGRVVPRGGGDERDMQFGLISYLMPRLTTIYGGDYPDESKRIYKTALNLSGFHKNASSWNEARRYEADDPRTAVCDRWKPHIADIVWPKWDGGVGVAITDQDRTFWVPTQNGRINLACVYRTIYDGWLNDLWYCCEPPHQSYTLLSTGPNGWKDPNQYIDRITGKVLNKDVWNSFIIRTDK